MKYLLMVQLWFLFNWDKFIVSHTLLPKLKTVVNDILPVVLAMFALIILPTP